MWLSERAAADTPLSDGAAALAEVTIGGENAAALAETERRGLAAAGPGGYDWLPEAGARVLLVRCGDGTAVIAGTLPDGAAAGLSPGDVRLRTRGASLCLRADGRIEVSGDVTVTGTLTVNGTPVPEEA